MSVKDKIVSAHHAKLSRGNEFYNVIDDLLDNEEYRHWYTEQIGKYDDNLMEWRKGRRMKIKQLVRNYEGTRDLVISLVCFGIWHSAQEGRDADKSLDSDSKKLISNYYVDLLKLKDQKKKIPDMPQVWERIYPKMERDLRESALYDSYRNDVEKMKLLVKISMDPRMSVKDEIISTRHTNISLGNRFYNTVGTILDDKQYRAKFAICLESPSDELSDWRKGHLVKLKGLFYNYEVIRELIIQLVCCGLWYSGPVGVYYLDHNSKRLITKYYEKQLKFTKSDKKKVADMPP